VSFWDAVKVSMKSWYCRGLHQVGRLSPGHDGFSGIGSVFMFRHQNEGQIHILKRCNNLHKYVEKSTHLAALLMIELCIYEEISNGQTEHLGNACYHFVLNLFTTHPPSKNVKTK
jgi:hypothetical protein